MLRSGSIAILASVILGVAVGLGAYTFIYAKGYSYLTDNPALTIPPRAPTAT